MKILDIHEFRECDRHGCGYFGASRGGHTHEGVDMVAYPNDNVYAPFTGTITKYGYCYAGNSHYRYIEVTGKSLVARILYAELDNAFDTGDKVPEGQFLGLVQDIAAKYEGITPHVHFELYKPSDTLRKKPIDPTEYLKKKEIL